MQLYGGPGAGAAGRAVTRLQIVGAGVIFSPEMLAAWKRTRAAYVALIADPEAERERWGGYGRACRLCEAARDGDGDVDCDACVLGPRTSPWPPCVTQSAYALLRHALDGSNPAEVEDAAVERLAWLDERAEANGVVS